MIFNRTQIFVIVVVGALFILTTACSAAPSAVPTNESEPAMEHDDAHEHDETGAEHSDGHIPNNGAVVKIVSPQDGAEIKAGSDIKVEIETEDFELGTDGNHWHIFVDGESRGMIMGADHDEVVRGLEPGEHQLGAFLSNGAHEELEDGATITIIVVE